MDRTELLDAIRATRTPIEAPVGAATDDELFRRDPHPWLDGTVAETVERDSTGHYPEHVPHLA